MSWTVQAIESNRAVDEPPPDVAGAFFLIFLYLLACFLVGVIARALTRKFKKLSDRPQIPYKVQIGDFYYPIKSYTRTREQLLRIARADPNVEIYHKWNYDGDLRLLEKGEIIDFRKSDFRDFVLRSYFTPTY